MAAQTLRSEFLCTLNGFVGSPRDIGTTPRGTRRYYPAIGGSFEGPRLRGEVLPDGGNRLLIRPDGVLEQEVRITLRTDDDAFIYVRYVGVRHGPSARGSRRTWFVTRSSRYCKPCSMLRLPNATSTLLERRLATVI
jgi:hypothetical protein